MNAIRCPVCGANVRVSTTTSKRGKPSIVLACPKDGRHFRGFINDRDFVASVVAKLEEKA